MTGTPLGCIPLDSAQTIRKTYVDSKQAHRTIQISEPWNKVSYTYNNSCQVTTATYIWEEIAEVTEVTTNDDVCSSLNDQGFILFTKIGTQFRIRYNVSGAGTSISDTSDIKYIDVDVIENDPSSVIALATKLSLDANTLGSCHYTVNVVDNLLTFTHTRKGDTSDTIDSGTCFTFTPKTQGVTNTVEVLTYEYDTNGRCKSITNTSGDNVLGIDYDPKTANVGIAGDGRVVGVSSDRGLLASLTNADKEAVDEIIKELKMMNLYLESMSDEQFSRQDIENED